MLDQITFDILWNRLISAVNEQAAALVRSSFTSMLREAGDLSACVFDRRGRMIAQATTGTPGHINSIATGMRHFVTRFPERDLGPGDVLITNDPWKTASELNDITVATPVFNKGRLVAFFANCCHSLDVGGRGLAADSRSIFEEGLQIPMMKIREQGRLVQPFFDLLAANVRAPAEVLGDLHSQIICNDVGSGQLLGFLDEFDLNDIEELADTIIDRTEFAMRRRIAEIPDGRYQSELSLDGFDEPIVLRAAVTVSGDAVEVDYAGSSPSVPLAINVALNYARAYTIYGLKCLISPDVPNNEGSFRPITVTAPSGCILNANYPSAVGARHLVGHFVPSLMMSAMAKVLPDKVMAPGFDGLWQTHVSGEAKGSIFSYTWFSAGGTGALFGKDGLSATAFPSGIASVPVEVIESISPVVIRRRALRANSGGAGRWRGGLGQVTEFDVLTDRPYQFSPQYERLRCGAPGLAGGSPGVTGRLSFTNDRGIGPKDSGLLGASAGVTLELPGGGGYGNAFERDVGAVLADVKAGYVSAQAAFDLYGVSLEADARAVDAAATTARRATLARMSETQRGTSVDR